ncbi:MAG: glycosyltransferase family 39 protein [Rhodanobacteraceae bacterium]
MNAISGKSDRPLRTLAPWVLLLLPLAILFPPIPIDETRYLTAAWEMFNSGQWLVPTVNGAWYSDKSPLLFWLIAGGWKIFGVHTCVARVEALVIALGMLLMLRRLATRLGFDQRGADNAMWLLAGSAGFALFATAIMFDLLLAACVLGALHALLDLDARRYARGTSLLGAMIGLGILAKGPVVLLHIAGVALLAPLWSEHARAAKARWYFALFAGLLIGVTIALCWLLPAAMAGGPSYWQPLLAKVTGRLHESFAHRRPIWWYLPLIPILLLPWVLALRAPGAAWRALSRERIGVFIACWWLLPFLAFCVISGKQIHYLTPLLPAWALAGARLLQGNKARIALRLYALFALLIAVGLCWLPWWAARTYGYAPQPALMLFALVGVIVAIGLWLVWGHDARSLALAATALTSTALLTGALALSPALDVRPEAAFVAAAQRDRVPIAHVEWHNGLFGYTGRLQQPLPVVARDEIVAWCRAHPRGILLASDANNEPQGVAPRVQWPYLLSDNHRIGAWSAKDILSAVGSH